MGEGDLGVDQLLNLVLGVVAAGVVFVFVFVVGIFPAPPVSVVFVVVLEGAVRRLDVGEREDGLTACFFRGDPQQGYPARVRAFQPPPSRL